MMRLEEAGADTASLRLNASIGFDATSYVLYVPSYPLCPLILYVPPYSMSLHLSPLPPRASPFTSYIRMSITPSCCLPDRPSPPLYPPTLNLLPDLLPPPPPPPAPTISLSPPPPLPLPSTSAPPLPTPPPLHPQPTCVDASLLICLVCLVKPPTLPAGK